MILRRISNIKPTNYAKIPIFYPANLPPTPLNTDYEVLKVTPEATNREIVKSFRLLVSSVHPSKNVSFKAQEEYKKLVEAYDKVVLHRMHQNGVPQPFTFEYYPPARYSKVIKDFIDENSFWTPHVSENYNTAIFVFWAVFGMAHTLLEINNPFLIS
jgi:DnaJ domain